MFRKKLSSVIFHAAFSMLLCICEHKFQIDKRAAIKAASVIIPLQVEVLRMECLELFSHWKIKVMGE